MIAASLLAFLHFAAVFVVFGTVFFEWLTLGPAPTLQEARRLQWADRLYGIAAGVVIVAGVFRVVRFEKGWAFYSVSPFFYVKMGLFLIVGLLSIYPTIRFIRWGAQTKRGAAPVLGDGEYRRLALTLRLELLLLFAVALSASLMARAVGL